MSTKQPPTRPTQRHRLDALIRRLKSPTSAAPRTEIPRREGDGPWPLSFAQGRLWLLDRLQPGTALYNMPGALALRGDEAIDVGALGGAVAALGGRHEALRTRFVETVDGPAQDPADASMSCALVDLDRLADPARRLERDRLARREARRPFDLARGPLLRAALLREDPHRGLLLLHLHHIAADGWSLGILFAEIAELYAAAIAGRTARLARRSIDYLDFAAWQRRTMNEEALAGQVDFWRERLEGVPVLELPLDRPRPAVRRGLGGELRRPLLSRAGLELLDDLARAHRATRFHALVAAVQLLLTRITDQRDLALGSPIAGRDRPQLEGMVGVFVNTLVLRLASRPGAAFGDLLDGAREASLSADAHRDIPFERLVELLRPERRNDATPFFQVAVAVEDAMASRRAAGLEMKPTQAFGGAAKFDLTVFLRVEDDRLDTVLEYDRDLFDRTTIERLARRFERLLSGALAGPRTPTGALALLGAAEAQQVLVEWNDTGGAEPFRDTLPGLPRRVPAERGAAVVADGPDGVLTYAALARRMTTLAAELRARGVGADTAVALQVERSTRLVAAMAGILDAGGFYVPIDPDYPEERQAWMLEDCGAKVRIVDDGGADGAGLSIVGAATDRAGEPSGDSAAYVMYTSGSTGRPKGVAVTHANILRLARDTTYAADASGDVFLHLSTTSFDASTLEIWPALVAGARLVVAPPGRLGLEEIAALVARARISTLFLTTGLFHQMAETYPQALARPRRLWTGGDVLSPSHARRLLEALDGTTELVNGYGPTENTVISTAHLIRRASEVAASDLPGSAAPIGRAIDRSTAHVLDTAARPMPPGSAGELLVGGAGVARGYFGRPALTAERFVPDPFAVQPGARLYRTGDRARRLADGRIEFLGRADGQVKIRGFRIEPGEIEARLGELPGVEAAAVLARTGPDGAKRLVAYIVPTPQDGASAQRLRADLAERLPAHMVPSAFVELASLPLDPNGKLLRKALPDPDWSGAAAPFAAPEGQIEETLAAIWGELLGGATKDADVGADDDFFALGGHSLLATQAVSRIRARLGVELPLRRFFEGATVRGVASAVAELRDGPRGEAEDDGSPLVAVKRHPPPPASFAQERMWFLERLDPGRATYHVPLAVELRGALDHSALAAALGGIVARHEALRTALREVAGAPVQVVHAAPTRVASLPVVDLERLCTEVGGDAPEDACARTIANVTWAAATRPFDLERAPLLRALLLRVAGDVHHLILNIHHLAADGWSLGVLVREFGALYAAHRAGVPAKLPRLPVQYADFAVWQRGVQAADRSAARLETWRRRLDGVPALDLPTDAPRSAARGRGAVLDLALASGRVRALEARARECGATLFMGLVAAWSTLLGRFAGQRDLALGSPVAGRTRRELEDLIGLFVNTVALRVDLDGKPDFAALLDRVRGVTLEAYALQEVPFEKVVDALAVGSGGIGRDLGRSPLVQALLVLQNAPFAPLELEGLEIAPRALPTGTAKLDLHLALTEVPDGRLEGFLEYDRDLFDRPSIARLWSAFEVLLDGLEAVPEVAIDALPILPEADRRQILDGWSAVAAPFEPSLLHHRFERYADQAPLALAALFDDGSQALARWTYRDLDRAANRLAHLLLALGVRREARVGILMERSLELVAALLAVLKAGAAYVPLDPRAPLDRLRFMTAEFGRGIGAPIVLTQAHLRATATALGASMLLRTVEVDADPRLAEMPSARPEVEVDLDQAAYMLYTSGSTGRPKGVINAHRGISNRLDWTRAALPVGPGDRLLQKTPTTFDVSVWELFFALTSGVPLVLARPEGHKDPAYLAGLIRRAEITMLHFVPSMLQVFVDEPTARGGFPTVRRVLASGEALSADLVERCAEIFAAPLHNLYGPTEAAVDVTWWPCDRQAPILHRRRRVPIGRPIANVRTPIVDRRFELVPIGVAGELCLGGVQVARGYHARPGLTAERFVPDPWSAATSERLYRTGDLVRLLEDGAIDYLGRIDFQVKLRGQRIELGEIEAALLDRPEVRAAVVVLRRDGGEDRLVAYLTASSPEHGVDIAALRAALGRRLPEAMLPSALVVLEAMPLNASGKVDRRRLPAPSFSGSAEHVAPRTPLEVELAEIWRELLGVERVGATDGFFALGGHSLLATRLVARLRERFGVEMELRRIFETPTLEALAAHLGAALGEGARPSSPPLERLEDGAVPVVSFAQERLWLLDQLEPGASLYNLPIARRLRGKLEPAVLRAALDTLTRRHDTLRTGFVERDGAPRPRIAAQMAAPLVEVDLRRLGEEAREGAIRRTLRRLAKQRFALSDAPLWRAALLRAADEESVLAIVQHHILTDAWSLDLLAHELGVLLRAARADVPAVLAPLPVRYTDFAAWQRRTLDGDALAAELLDRELTAWRPILSDAPTLELPTDRPRTRSAGARGATHRRPLPAAAANGLRELARRSGASLFMVAAAAWSVWLARLTGAREVVFGFPHAGRGHRELEGVLGFFVNTLVLRAEISAAPSLRDAVDLLRRRVLEADAHQAVPFQRLVEEFWRGDRWENPFFRVFLAWRAATPDGLESSGLQGEEIELEIDQVKFDLSLLLIEQEDGLTASWAHRLDLIDRTTAQRWARSFEILVAALVERPDAPWEEAPLFDAAARQQILIEWNAQPKADWRLHPLHELVAAQAEAVPERVALVFGAEHWTYAGLEARANRLARRLARLGAAPGQVVAVCAERSIALDVALLAILKTGAAYVPLDIDLPTERRAFMLEDTRAIGVLTDPERVELLPSEAPIHLLGELERTTGHESAASLGTTAQLDDAAYILYTSGSTGRPKGVVIAHRSIAHRLLWTRSAELDPESRFLQKTSPSFDPSLVEIFAPLLTGACSVLAPLGAEKNAEFLAKTVAERRISNTSFPRPLLEALLQNPRAMARCADLRQVLVGGEKVPEDLPERFFAVMPETMILDVRYGPTETTISVTRLLRRSRRDRVLSIGRPIAGAEILVLDRRGHLAALGAAGELVLGGPLLARGYLDLPARTAASFTPHPPLGSTAPGARVYRTGDLVRLRADGEIEFLGRIDRQVKVRGFRVELGEIESALEGHPRVRQAAVVDLPDGSTRRLAAVVEPTGETPPPDAATLRAYLAEHLPEHMVPTVIGLRDALPLTPTGKLDRAAIIRLAAALQTDALGERVAPRTATEELLHGLWREILQRAPESFGVTDDFFALGGHSLSATQVLSRLRRSFGEEVALGEIFDRPTIAGLGELLDARAAGVTAPPLTPVDAPRDAAGRCLLPLSFAQERFWFLHQLEPDNPAYNVPAALELRGATNTAALRAALDRIVGRHGALRTTFEVVDGEPRQVIVEHGRMPLAVVDLGALGAADGERVGRRLVAAEARTPFDLAAGPLVRALLLRFSDARHILAVTMHHIVTDGWSMGVWVRELGALYRAAVLGEAARLPHLPVQYADYAVRQRAWLEGGEIERQLGYWREQLAGVPEVLNLPLDRPRPTRPTFRGGRHLFLLAEPGLERLHALARHEGATLFMVLLAAFAALLARLCGSRDLVVGAPVANRRRAEVEGLIGLFINTLVLRVRLDRRSTGREILGRARHAALGAFAHQDLPFERLVDALEVRRALEHSALYQAALALQNAGVGALVLPGLEIEPLDGASEGIATKQDLTLRFTESAAGLAGVVDYRADLFDRTTMVRLARQMTRLLHALAEDPDRPLDQFPLLDAAERHQALREWNPLPFAPDAELLTHQLFSRQAAARPDAVAAVFEDRRLGELFLSFGELERRSNRLAHRLRAVGVGPEVPTAFYLEHSLDTLLALLAVFKAGGAFMVLDPTLPTARLEAQLEDSRAAVVLTRAALADDLPAHDARTVELEELESGALDGLPATDPAVPVEPENFAYLIYTSGSTGRPKGVVGEHRQLIAYLRGVLPELGDPLGAAFGLHQSLAVDAPLTHLLAALCGGGRLELMDPRRVADPRAMGESLARRPLDYFKTASSVLEVLFGASHDPRGLLPRRLLMLGGEALPRALAEETLRHAPEITVLNHYGPTEATVGVQTLRVTSERLVGGGRIVQGLTSTVPIGRPLRQARNYVADRSLRLLPVGVPGEFLLGGDDCLARGYLGRPALSAACFIPDPFGGGHGARLYHSGDLVRILHDGTIEFLDRIDNQVKVRGFRIELGEIESALEEHPRVRAAVVTARRDRGETRLAAYVVGRGDGGEAPRPIDLRDSLRARLPEYMVPTRFTVLEHFPRTPHGKVDRKALDALPEPAGIGEESMTEADAPRDAVELRLVRVWSEVLGSAQVGIRDSFFDLGGHSLLAVRLLARIEREFDRPPPLRPLPLATLFEGPTIEHLAELLRSEGGEVERRVLVEIQAGDSDAPPFFCVHAVGGNVFSYVALARRLADLGGSGTFYGLQSPPPRGAAPTLEELAALYVDAVREARPSGPYLLGGWSMGGVVAYEMARLLRAEGCEVARVVLLDAPPPRLGRIESPVAADGKTEEYDAARIAANFVRDLTGGRAVVDPQELRGPDDDARLERVLEICRAAGVLPPGAGRDRLIELLETFERNSRAVRAYDPSPYGGRIDWLRAQRTAELLPDDGWKNLAADARIVHLPGDHYSLLARPDVERLAEEVARLLDLRSDPPISNSNT